MTRQILILSVLLALAAGGFAQETTTVAQPQPAAPAATTTGESGSVTTRQEVREEFGKVLGQHPSEVSRILALDPTLVSNEPFLARYPELAQFIAAHPEIRGNPHYYVRLFTLEPPRQDAPFEEAVETLTILAVFAFIAFALAWLVRTVIEQKRWNRLSRAQSEVHNKILDRFGSSAELLDYVRTPAGTKFLESAPIPLHADKPNAPLSRIMWSIQLGVVIAVASFGAILVSFRFSGNTAQELFAMGVIGFCLGGGFIASAVVSLVLSRRLGLWQEHDAPPASAFDDSGMVR